MEPIDNPSPAPAPAPAEDLQTQVDSLRKLVQALLALMVVVSGTISIYLFAQARYSARDRDVFRAQAGNLLTQYQKTSGPATDEFLKKLATYGSKHADFAPIVTKYGLDKALTNTASTNPAAAPKAAQPAKK
jgi:hypothetical protein